MMALVERALRVTFIKSNGESGKNALTLVGHRVSARIEKAGGPSRNFSEIAIYGMRLSLMNELSTWVSACISCQMRPFC